MKHAAARKRPGHIGLLPDYHAREAIASGALVRLLPDFTGQSVDAHVLYPSRRSLSAKVRVFIDALATHLRARAGHAAQ